MIGTGKVSEDSPWVDAGSITETDDALAVGERDVVTADGLDATKIINPRTTRDRRLRYLFCR